ncbi:hypothetical protein, partial [uncultured Brachyspira sp.]
MILENLYYSSYYKNHRLKYEVLFSDNNFESEKKAILNDDYYIIHKKYSAYIHQKDIIGYDRSIYKINDNKLIYNYKSDDARMFKIINHNNREYFIFNRDLSGFSILKLDNTYEEFSFYNNKFIAPNGTIVFTDAQYSNNKILFYIFYLLKSDNGTFKRIFDYLLFDLSDISSENNIHFAEIRKLVSNVYNHKLYFIYKAYFKDN